MIKFSHRFFSRKASLNAPKTKTPDLEDFFTMAQKFSVPKHQVEQAELRKKVAIK
jgi:hypothetical protein